MVKLESIVEDRVQVKDTLLVFVVLFNFYLETLNVGELLLGRGFDRFRFSAA